MNALLAYRDDYQLFLDQGEHAAPELRARIASVQVRAVQIARAEQVH